MLASLRRFLDAARRRSTCSPGTWRPTDRRRMERATNPFLLELV